MADKLYAFGWNGAGQLGTGDVENKKVACPVEPLDDKRVAMVACGGPYTVLATDTEEVWGFGANTRGQLGLGHALDQLMPRKLSPPAPLLSWKVEQISCGYAHTVFLTEDLSVYSCGANSWGQLGLGDTDDRNHPCLVERLSRVAVRQLDCGAAHTMVVCEGPRDKSAGGPLTPAKVRAMLIDSDEPRSPDDAPDEQPDEPNYPEGSGVYGFGRNKEGQLGLGNRALQGRDLLSDQIQKEPREVTSLSQYLLADGGIELRCGGYHTAVLVQNRTRLLTFGQNCYGQLGLGDLHDRFAPDEVELPVAKPGVKDPIEILACGGGHTMVVTESKQVLAFGRNNRGQLGVGDMDHHGLPSLVKGLCGRDIVQVECGSKHTIVLTAENELYAIGRNTEGQLGMGEVEQKPDPTPVKPDHWIPSHGHLSVGGFSAHNFFVPVPKMEERRAKVRVLVGEQKRAMAMCLHRRLGNAAPAHMLSHDLIVYICTFLPKRRTGILLAEGEDVISKSPSVTAILNAMDALGRPSRSQPAAAAST